MTDPILPTADQILSKALDKFYTLRPSAFPHINLRNGVYWHPFAAHRAQIAFMLRRASSLVAANRLSTAEGAELLEYVGSEYETVPDAGRTFAIGEVTFERPEALLSGDIPKGSRLVRAANLTTHVPFPAATYETLADAHFDVGQLTVGPVPIRAVSDGISANHVLRTDDVPHGVTIAAGRLFDPGITVGEFSAAGGSDGLSDPYVKSFAQAFAAGQYGPTNDASRYGALSSTGVRNLLVYDIPGTGTQRILVADAAWGSSDRLAAVVQQQLYDEDLVGVGCRVEVRRLRNKVISVAPTVQLRDPNYLSDTSEIEEAIRVAVRSYFDNRVDWNVWKTRALRAAITRAHRKILSCSDVVVRDVNGDTVDQIATPDLTQEQLHHYLANNAVTTTFTGPA